MDYFLFNISYLLLEFIFFSLSAFMKKKLVVLSNLFVGELYVSSCLSCCMRNAN